MASINNVTIKSLKKFSGHDGEEIVQGNIYLNGKKLGFWSQDAWCGPDSYHFNSDILSSVCKDYQQGFPKDYKYYNLLTDPDIFMSKVSTLIRMESSFKPYFKKGYKTIVVVMNSYEMCWVASPEDEEDAKLLKRYSKQIEDAKNEIKGGPKVCVFRENDFDLIVDKDHKAPPYLR